ncbi:hypothetical protein H312_00235, partial [Anncaliia algerae PRA339]
MVTNKEHESYNLWDNEGKQPETHVFDNLINKQQDKNEKVVFASDYNPFLSDDEKDNASQSENITKNTNFMEEEFIDVKKNVVPEIKLDSSFFVKNNENEIQEIIMKEGTSDLKEPMDEKYKSEDDIWSDNETDFLAKKLENVTLKEEKHVSFSDKTETFFLEKEKATENKKLEEFDKNLSRKKDSADEINILKKEESKNNEQEKVKFVPEMQVRNTLEAERSLLNRSINKELKIQEQDKVSVVPEIQVKNTNDPSNNEFFRNKIDAIKNIEHPKMKFIPEAQITNTITSEENTFTTHNKEAKKSIEQEKIKLIPERQVKNVTGVENNQVKLINNILPKIKADNDDQSGFNFNRTSKLIKIKGYTILGYPNIQKRIDFKTQKEKEIINSKFIFYKNNNRIELSKLHELRELNDLINLKDKTIDNVCKIVTQKKIKFIHENIVENSCISDINLILNTYFLNKEIAIQMAVEKKIWHLALFISNCDGKVKEAYLNNFNQEIKVYLLGRGELNDQWRDTFELLLRNPNESLINDLIKKVSDVDKAFILLSLYFVHGRKFSCKLFFNNFYFLLIFLEKNVLTTDIDVLLMRFIKILQDEGLNDLEREIYQKYKRILKKEMIDNIENKKGWFTGFKTIIDKSISKIVGVESKEDDENKLTFGEETTSIKETGNEKIDATKLKKSQAITKNTQINTEIKKILNEDNSNKEIKNNELLGDTIKLTNDVSKERNQIKPTESKKYSQISIKSKICNEEAHPKEKEALLFETEKVKEISEEELINKEKKILDQRENTSKEMNNLYKNSTATKSTSNLPHEEKSLYMNNDHAKSLENFFVDDENTPGLDTLMEEKVKEEEKPSFFSRFNIFAKKKNIKHKIELKGEDDFVYDPITKKWTTSSQKNTKPEIKEEKKQQSTIPKPSIKKKDTNFDLNGSISSRYVNKDVKEEETNVLKNFIPKPK